MSPIVNLMRSIYNTGLILPQRISKSTKVANINQARAKWQWPKALRTGGSLFSNCCKYAPSHLRGLIQEQRCNLLMPVETPSHCSPMLRKAIGGYLRFTIVFSVAFQPRSSRGAWEIVAKTGKPLSNGRHPRRVVYRRSNARFKKRKAPGNHTSLHMLLPKREQVLHEKFSRLRNYIQYSVPWEVCHTR